MSALTAGDFRRPTFPPAQVAFLVRKRLFGTTVLALLSRGRVLINSLIGYLGIARSSAADPRSICQQPRGSLSSDFETL